ncbi:hypothetical protein FHS96_000880 [Sphingomonas zeicaulis]|uniref:DUF4267 domain-containing protein n=1 Tax=Sphingomonas zeicaulis TaxID=1632740 RepID=UPI003D1957C3
MTGRERWYGAEKAPGVVRALVLIISCLFFVLGFIFVLAPAWGIAIYGLDPVGASALPYVRALGCRDLALAAYLVGLNLLGDRKPLATVLLATAIIPCGDMILLAGAAGVGMVNYLLHAGSLLCFVGLGLWVYVSKGAKPVPSRRRGKLPADRLR